MFLYFTMFFIFLCCMLIVIVSICRLCAKMQTQMTKQLFVSQWCVFYTKQKTCGKKMVQILVQILGRLSSVSVCIMVDSKSQLKIQTNPAYVSRSCPFFLMACEWGAQRKNNSKREQAMLNHSPDLAVLWRTCQGAWKIKQILCGFECGWDECWHSGWNQ